MVACLPAKRKKVCKAQGFSSLLARNGIRGRATLDGLDQGSLQQAGLLLSGLADMAALVGPNSGVGIPGEGGEDESSQALCRRHLKLYITYSAQLLAGPAS